MAETNKNHRYSFVTEKLRDVLGSGPAKRRIGPLSQLNRTGKITICKVAGDRALCSRMAAIGLYPGSEIELVGPECSGQCMLKVHGATLCLDQTLTDNIFVEVG